VQVKNTPIRKVSGGCLHGKCRGFRPGAVRAPPDVSRYPIGWLFWGLEYGREPSVSHASRKAEKNPNFPRKNLTSEPLHAQLTGKKISDFSLFSCGFRASDCGGKIEDKESEN